MQLGRPLPSSLGANNTTLRDSARVMESFLKEERDERGQQPSVYRRSFNKKPKGCPEPIMGHDVRLTPSLVCPSQLV